MILALITRLFTGEAGIYFARLKRLVGLYVVLGIFALALLVFLLIALFIWASHHFGALETALAFAGAFFILLVITFVMTLLAKRRPATRATTRCWLPRRSGAAGSCWSKRARSTSRRGCAWSSENALGWNGS